MDSSSGNLFFILKGCGVGNVNTNKYVHTQVSSFCPCPQIMPILWEGEYGDDTHRSPVKITSKGEVLN